MSPDFLEPQSEPRPSACVKQTCGQPANRHRYTQNGYFEIRYFSINQGSTNHFNKIVKRIEVEQSIYPWPPKMLLSDPHNRRQKEQQSQRRLCELLQVWKSRSENRKNG